MHLFHIYILIQSSRMTEHSLPVAARCQDGARKSALLEDNNNLMSNYYSEARTLYEVFQRGLKVSGDRRLHRGDIKHNATRKMGPR